MIYSLLLIGIVAGLIKISYVVPYTKGVFKANVRPNRASWLIWFILGLIAFFSQLAKGASYSLFMTAALVLASLWIFCLSLFKGEGGFNFFDLSALLAAGIGLLLWYFFKEPLYSLFAVIFVDFVGLLLTYKKTYNNFQSESLLAWTLSGLGSFISIFAVGRWGFALLLYPVYTTFSNFSEAGLIYFFKYSNKGKND